MESKSNFFKGSIIVILLLLLTCAGICTHKYISQPLSSETYVCEDTAVILPITKEEAMKEYLETKEFNRCFDVYMKLPEVIVSSLFDKLGTEASVEDYVYEYEKNKEYYISLQVSNILEKIGLKDKGVDGDKIKQVQVKTELKESQDLPVQLKVNPDSSYKK